MASTRWQGGAPAIAQVRTYTFTGTWVVGDLITVTIGSKAWAYAITSTTIGTFLPLLVTAYNALSASVYPEQREQTAAGTSPALTLTAATAGKPFTATISTNSAAGLINGAASSAGTATTASSGPNDWSTAANWSTGSIPVAGDTVYIDNSDDAIKYGLSQAGATVTACHIAASFTGTIGLPEINADGTEYYEYRTRQLTLDCTTWNIGLGEGNGSQSIQINSGSVQTTVNLFLSSSGAYQNKRAVEWKGTHASNVLNAYGGEIGVAMLGGETATLLTLRLDAGTVVACGAGVTLGTVTNYGGDIQVNSAIGTSIRIEGGTCVINGSGAVAQLDLANGAACTYNTTGTLNGATTISDGSVLDFNQDTRAKTVPNPIDCFSGGQVLDDHKAVATLVVDYNNMSVPGFGTNVRLTRGVPA